MGCGAKRSRRIAWSNDTRSGGAPDDRFWRARRGRDACPCAASEGTIQTRCRPTEPAPHRAATTPNVVTPAANVGADGRRALDRSLARGGRFSPTRTDIAKRNGPRAGSERNPLTQRERAINVRRPSVSDGGIVAPGTRLRPVARGSSRPVPRSDSSDRGARVHAASGDPSAPPGRV